MENKHYYKKIFSYFKPYKKIIIIYVLTSIITMIMGTVTPFVSAQTIQAITKFNVKAMIIFSSLYLIVNIVSELLNTINRRSSYKLQDFISLDIKADASKKIFELETKNFDKNGTGFFSSRINGEPREITSIFSMFNYNFLGTISSFGVLIYTFIISYKITIMLLMFSALLFFIDSKRIKKRIKNRETIKDLNESYSSNFNEIIRGIRDVKVLNIKNNMINKTLNQQKEIFNIEYKNEKEQDIYSIISMILRYIADFLIIILGILLIKNNELNAANLLVIYMYRWDIFSVFKNASRVIESLKDFNISVKRLYSVIDSPEYPKEKFGNIKLDKLNGSIEFKNVNFGYNDKLVLKDISFKINPNETVGFVGKSGQGKTTIFNLISKLYDVNDGKILLDDIDINDLTEGSIRNNISVITQDPYIFNTTIKENLKIVKENVTDEEIIKSTELSALDDYIKTLEKKYDTKVGEDGVMLSGGQKQRLAIARAILKKSEIILLDEATSSLDNNTQNYIKDSIKRISKDYTILIIAHRLSTIKDCDKIIVIDDGRVVGVGNHNELIRNNEIYKELYKKELTN